MLKFIVPLLLAAIPGPTFTTVQTENVCCGATPTAFPTALAGRTSLLEQNQNGGTCWIGTASVDAGFGIEVAGGTPGASVVENANATVARYCIASPAMISDGGCLFVQESK